ncbi:MAG TPA: toxic anion resistance protein [Candidatus Dormibacteraeota bacterium]
MTADTPEAAADAVSLSLSAPEAAATVGPAEAEREVTIDPEAAKRIDGMVATFISGIRSVDVHGDDYRRRVDDIDSLADREIRTTSDMSNRLLDRPTRAMQGLGQGDAPIAKSLLDLRRSVEELNPAKHDLTQGGPRKLLGVIPFGDRVRAYFAKYQKSQSHIEGIVGALREGGGELEKDNAAIAQEQKGLWSQMESLRQYAYMAEKLDTGLEAQVNHIAIGDPERAKVLQEDILYPVRRRRQEILTQLAVAVQGYAALRVVEVNNRELVRAVRTATTTTVAALRTAVMVAQALTNQKLVSEQVRAVNETTSAMIESTSAVLREQTTTVESQAASPGLDMGSLQRAWDNVFAALDQIDTYKLRALQAMKITVDNLSDQVERSHAQVERLHSADATPPRISTPSQSLRLS